MSASSSYMPGSIPTAPWWPTSLPASHRGIPQSSIRSGLSDMASNCSSIPGFPRCAPTPVRWCATSSPDTTWTGSTWTTTSTPPYPIAGEAFDDEAAYRLYGQAFASKDDWRRNNVTQLIRDLSQTIRSVKPYVQLGISPFGIYRNERTHPVGSKTGGLQNYDDLYADILLWDREGLMDYVVPQIYWNMGHKVADYTELVLWWSH